MANLCAKIAPWLVDAVIDNSSWNLKAFMLEDMDYEAFKTIGFGKEIDLVNLRRFHYTTENFILHADEKTFWTSDENSPFYCSASRLEIRDVANFEHLKAQAKIKKFIYRGYHGSKDWVAPFALKKDFWDKLKKLKFDAKTNEIKAKSQIDGRLIKSLEHGLGMSLKTLILKETPPLLELLKNTGEYKGKKGISFETDEWIYSFKESKNKLIPSCQISGLQTDKVM